MNVLWVINIPLPEASLLLNEKPFYFGGWLINTSKELVKQKEIKLTIAFPKKGVNKSIKLIGEKINYYAFKPVSDQDKRLINENFIFEEIIKDEMPDLVHIFGTELAHTLSMVNICKKNKIKTVISIQGLVSFIEQHMYSNLPNRIIKGNTLRNLLMKDNVEGLRKLYKKRGGNEIQALKNADHIIGRTTWDKACTSQINQLAKYHFCNETLREEFYKHKWKIEECEKHSIFLSQGQYPIKGLHLLLEAMPIILKHFPDTKLYVSGKDITKSNSFKEKLLMTYYGKYIKKLIKQFHLENKIIFTGPLDEKEMCRRYLRSNVFVCPSTIENSPNSLGEAMILGLPCVASNVGGISDMLTHKDEGFIYQADAPYMLAYYICEIFKNKNLAIKFSRNARKHALMTHNIDVNTNTLIEIYKSITDEDEIKKIKYYQMMGG